MSKLKQAVGITAKVIVNYNTKARFYYGCVKDLLRISDVSSHLEQREYESGFKISHGIVIMKRR